MPRLKSLRVLVIVMLSLLALQFELGMAVNLSPNLQEVPPLPSTDSAVWGALGKVGGEAVTHAVLGFLLTLAAVAVLIFCVASGSPSVMVIGILAFAGVVIATVTGILFTLSGFKNDGDSHGMATGFLVAFSLHFVLLCILSVKLRRSVTS